MSYYPDSPAFRTIRRVLSVLVPTIGIVAFVLLIIMVTLIVQLAMEPNPVLQ